MTTSRMRGEGPRGPLVPGRRFAELSVVALTHAVEAGGQWLPSGSRGTVVAAYADGVGYEVEFEQPFHAVVTLSAGDLAA